MSMANFDATLEGWVRLDEGETRIPTDVRLGAENVIYSNIDAVATLTDTYDWQLREAIYAFAGGTDADTIDGAASLYRIEADGLTGDDQIIGSDFGDRLVGCEGADRFFHTGDAGHGTGWIQDFGAADGVVLFCGGAATADQFQVNFGNTSGAGSAGVAEAFVIHQPTGQILWALVDGAAQDEITLRLGGQQFDLLA